MPKISVLMPVYNAEKYLAKAIDSIICQTFEDWELIIIDDGSTDSSHSIIESYNDPRVQHIQNEQNLGLIKTLNKGIALCSGEYIARMDADDIASPQRLEIQCAFLDKNTDYILCGSTAQVINKDDEQTGKIVNPSDDSILQISLLFTNPFVHPSMMIRKRVLLENTFDEKWVHVEDFELWTRLAEKGKIANIKQALLQYRWHDTNISVQHSSIQEKAKNVIIKLQLAKFGLDASNEEIDLHRLTFKLYSLGRKNIIEADQLAALSNWFLRLKGQNKSKNRYSQNDFEAFLWSRWIVLCITLNKKAKAFSPPFVSFKPAIIMKTLQLVIYLSKK